MAQPISPFLNALVQRFAPRVKHPLLFLAVLVLFVVDLLIPDLIPFIDEVMLGLLSVLLGSWRARREPGPSDSPPAVP